MKVLIALQLIQHVGNDFQLSMTLLQKAYFLITCLNRLLLSLCRLTNFRRICKKNSDNPHSIVEKFRTKVLSHFSKMAVFTARSSNASAILGVAILSVRYTRAL